MNLTKLVAVGALLTSTLSLMYGIWGEGSVNLLWLFIGVFAFGSFAWALFLDYIMYVIGKKQADIESLHRQIVGAKFRLLKKITQEGEEKYTLKKDGKSMLVDVPYLQAIQYLTKNMDSSDECFTLQGGMLTKQDILHIWEEIKPLPPRKNLGAQALATS